MCDERELWVTPSSITLPVWVVGDIASGDGDRVDEGEWLVGSGGWVAELRVEGDTIRAGWVDGEEAADYFPDTSGLECVFLEGEFSKCLKWWDDEGR